MNVTLTPIKSLFEKWTWRSGTLLYRTHAQEWRNTNYKCLSEQRLRINQTTRILTIVGTSKCSFMKMSPKASLRTTLSVLAVWDIQVFDSDLLFGTYVTRMNIPSGLNLIAIGTFVPGGPLATSSLVKKEVCIENDWLIRRRSCWVWLSDQIYVCYNVAEEKELGKLDWDHCTINALLGPLLTIEWSTNDVSLTLNRIGGWRVLLPPQIQNTSSLRWNSLCSNACLQERLEDYQSKRRGRSNWSSYDLLGNSINEVKVRNWKWFSTLDTFISQRAQGYATSRLISDRPLLLGVPAGLLDIPFPPKKVMYVKVYIKFGEKEKCKEEWVRASAKRKGSSRFCTIVGPARYDIGNRFYDSNSSLIPWNANTSDIFHTETWNPSEHLTGFRNQQNCR